MSKRMRGAVIGYGGAFNMGRHHGNQMQAAGIDFVAACDVDPARMAQARADFPHLRTYTKVGDLLADPGVDLVVLIVPHNTHAPLALQALQAGKHVISEKPFTITVEEATEIIETARQRGLLATVYHNRRWDGRFVYLRDAVRSGKIGDVFHVEVFMGNPRHPGTWWRSNKSISGGIFYDWGAHLVDWVLNTVEAPVQSVRGFIQKRKWMDVTNEDHMDVVVSFQNGAVAFFQQSNLAYHAKPWIRVLGTGGALVDGGDHWIWYTEKDGVRVEGKIPFPPDAGAQFYVNVAAHLYGGAPLIITPESARRVIGVIEYAELSAREGRELPVPYEE